MAKHKDHALSKDVIWMDINEAFEKGERSTQKKRGIIYFDMHMIIIVYCLQ